MNHQPGHGLVEATPAVADTLMLRPDRSPRAAAGPGHLDPARGLMRPKQPRDYYLDGLATVFQPGVSLPGPLQVDQKFSGAVVALLYPGPDVVEVLGILNRFPEIKFLHLIESSEKNLEAIRSGLGPEAGRRELPGLAGYVASLGQLPESLAGRCDLVVEINVVDPKSDRLFRQDAAAQISGLLKTGGLFYSAGVTIRWTDGVVPLSLVRVPVRARHLKRAGYSDALPRPVFHLRHSPDGPAPIAEESRWRRWWEKSRTLLGRDARPEAAVEAPFVPRVEDGRGEPNTAPWDFLITKPAVRRPAMDWQPRDGDRFGNLTLGSLLQFNRQTGMYVFRVRERPDVVLKIMKPFEGDLPDDPLEWARLRKSKTLKRENQALKLLKDVRFIPQRLAHGYDPFTGWYAIVVEFEPSRSLANLIDRHHNRLHRRHETPADVEGALPPLLKLLNSLAVVHDKGLVHQDLKPAHVFLPPDSPETVLIDWGLARKIDEPLSEETRSGSLLHAPPERTDPDIVAAARPHQDLYAVGVMLLQLAAVLDLEERPRFLLDHFSRHGRLPAAAELEPLLRPHWKWAAPVIARAISSRKEIPGYAGQRYTSAREMAADIILHYGKPLPPLAAENPAPDPAPPPPA